MPKHYSQDRRNQLDLHGKEMHPDAGKIVLYSPEDQRKKPKGIQL
jgi:hypothetical protein